MRPAAPAVPSRPRARVPRLRRNWTYRCPLTTDVKRAERPEAAGPASSPDASPAPPPAGIVRSPRVLLIAGVSVATGVIHAKALIDHASHYWLFGVFFGALTYIQVLWGVQLYRRPDDRRLFGPIAVMSLGVVAIWLLSRTVGIPIGPWASEAEPVGMADFAASVNELVLAALIFAILRPDRRFAARLAWLDKDNCVRVGSMLCALSLMALLMGSHSHVN